MRYRQIDSADNGQREGVPGKATPLPQPYNASPSQHLRRATKGGGTEVVCPRIRPHLGRLPLTLLLLSPLLPHLLRPATPVTVRAAPAVIAVFPAAHHGSKRPGHRRYDQHMAPTHVPVIRLPTPNLRCDGTNPLGLTNPTEALAELTVRKGGGGRTRTHCLTLFRNNKRIMSNKGPIKVASTTTAIR